MPSTRFATELLKGAQGGLGQGLQAAFGAGHRRQQAEDNAMMLQSRVAQALANIRQSDAAADLSAAKADGELVAADALRGRPGQLEESVALSTGTGLPIVQAVRAGARAGTAPQMELPGPTMDGGALTGPIDPAIVSKVGQALARVLPLMSNVKDFNPDQLAKAADSYRDQDLSSSIIAGQLNPQRVAAAQAAAAGKPMFHSDATGGVLDLFGGALNTDNPMAASTIGLRGSQALQAAAGARENDAQARAADATAGLRGVQAGAVGKSQKSPVGYRWTTDDATGEPKLEPIPGGPKDPNAQTGKPLPASASKGLLENQTNLRRAQEALALASGQDVGPAKGDAAATGWKGYLPNKVLNRLDPAGVDARAALSDLGSLVIHDRSGAAVTAAEFPRLAPFIPEATDDAATVKKKLQRFVDVYNNEVGQQVDFYKASGYNVPDGTLRPANTGAAPAPGPAALAPAPRPGRVDLNAGKPDRIAILQQEWLRQPADREQIARELKRLGAAPPADRRAPQPAAAAPSGAGGFKYLGTE